MNKKILIMMNSRISAAAALLSLLPLAALAESPTRAIDWTGGHLTFYGGHARSNTFATDITGEEYGTSDPGETMSLDTDDLHLGLAAGYDLQRGNIVYGGAFELGRINNQGLAHEPERAGDTVGALLTAFDTYMSLTGRIGYARDRNLFFVKAGVIRAKLRNAGGEFDGIGEEGSDGIWGFDGDEAGFGDESRNGYVLGLGFEHAISQRVTLTGEYNYADFGTATYGHVNGDMSAPFSFKNELHLFKFGLSYKF